MACLTVALSLFVPFQGRAEDALSQGSFLGGRTTGSVSIIQRDGQVFVKLNDDFVHEGAPDP